MKKYSLGALVAAGLLVGGLSAGSASAADLGGNCCADLEERIAELEATTARKGNRKVSLTISGWVAEQVMWWDDGAETNVYVGGIGATLSSHFKFTGQATISPGWYAGYVMHVEVASSQPYAGGWNQDSTGRSGAVGDVYLLQDFWFVKSDHYGKLSVGKQSQASDNTAILVDGSGSLVPANWVLFDNSDFFLRAGGARTGMTWGDIGYCHQIGLGIGGDCNGVPENSVRYDSPTFGGFSVSASWGEDDFWDVAARYAGEHAGFKFAAAAAYSQSTDNSAFAYGASSFDDLLIPGFIGLALDSGGKRDVGYFQVGAYIEHTPTGLFAYGAYGRENVDSTYQSTLSLTIFGSPIPLIGPADTTGFLVPNDNPDHWYVKAGVRERWSTLGHTVLYGEYAKRNDMLNPQSISDVALASFVASGFTDVRLLTGSEMRQWGLGAVQEIDAAAMSVYISWKHFEGEADFTDVATGTTGTVDFEEFDLIKAGALINF